MKSAFWKKDWFLGLVVTLVLLLAAGTPVIRSLELTAYDWGVRTASRTPSDKIVVIAIDESSIRNIGRWPWSRDVHAKMADILASAKAKTVGNLVFFSEPQVDSGLVYIRKLLEITERMPAVASGEVGNVLRDAEQSLDTDRRLAESYAKAGNLLLPMLFELGEPRGNPDKPLPDFVVKNRLTAVASSQTESPLPASAAISLPIEGIGNSAAGIGHLTH